MHTTKEEIEAIAKELVDAMLTVHRELGPGLLESTYQACLAFELRSRGIEVQCEAELPVSYKGLQIEAGYRVDILVAGCIIVENKSIQAGSDPRGSTADVLEALRAPVGISR